MKTFTGKTFTGLAALMAATLALAAPAQAQNPTDAHLKEINCVYSSVAALENDDDFYAIVDTTVTQATEGALSERANKLLSDILDRCVDMYEWDSTEMEFALAVGAYGAVADAVTANLEEDGVLDVAIAAAEATADQVSDADLTAIYGGKLMQDAALRGRATALMKKNGLPEVEAVTLEDALLYLEAMVISTVYVGDWADYAGF